MVRPRLNGPSGFKKPTRRARFPTCGVRTARLNGGSDADPCRFTACTYLHRGRQRHPPPPQGGRISVFRRTVEHRVCFLWYAPRWVMPNGLASAAPRKRSCCRASAFLQSCPRWYAPRDRSQFLRTQDPLDARRWPELVWPNLFRLLRRNSGSTGVEGKPGSAHRRAGR